MGLVEKGREKFTAKMICLNAAYFGRGDGARELVKNGVLRRDFGDDFQKEILELTLAKREEGFRG
jgi:hypothetical protein